MKTLKDIDMCTHSDSSECFYHLFLLYKAQNAVMQLPSGHPPFACEHCKWFNRGEDFYTPMEGGD